MFCPKCGRELMPNADVCLGCGRNVKTMLQEQNDTNVSAGWWWLGFLVPLAGFILWLVWLDSSPNKAKKVGFGALIGTIVSVALVILFYVLWFALIFFLGFGMYL